MNDVHGTIEAVARESYGRLVAYLATRTRDVAAAEDALADAFVAALSAWPRDGLPDKPEAWLLTAARNRLIDRARSNRRIQTDSTSALEHLAASADDSDELFPDERLKLMFVCTHPAIALDVHTPLMLQTVLGLTCEQIARAFVASPATLAQRLVRAKTKIRDAGIPFEVPAESQLPQRLDAVLQAIYAAYGHGWEDAAGVDPRARGLADEAIWLARVLTQRLPDEPEARGLLAVILYCESRRHARRSNDGGYIPLSEQDPALWSQPMIQEAERELTIASQHQRPGRFQLEAAIQSVHAERARTGRTDWHAIAAFYRHLIQIAPALGARLGHAAAIAEVHGPSSALDLLDNIPSPAIATHQPYWALRAHVLDLLGRKSEAYEAFERAVGLAEDPAVRQFLLRRRG